MTSSVVREAPSLRYGWHVVSFADILTETRNGLYKHEDSYGRGTPILKMFNIQRLNGAWVLDRLDRVEISSDEKEDFALREGDILLNRVNSREWVGKCAVVTAEVAGAVFESKNMRLRFNRALAEPEFIALWLNGELGRTQMDGLARQIAGMATVNKGDLATLRLPLPPLNEQRRIAARLKTLMAEVTSARAAAEAQMAAIRSYLDSALRDAFCDIAPLSIGGSTATPPGWRWRSLLDLARLETGHTPSRNHPEWWGGEVPWIALPDIRRLDCREANETLERTNAEGLANSSARLLPPGTVCLSRTASVGFVTILGRAMATSQDFVNWICRRELDPWFLLWALRASREFIRSQSTGAIHKTVYLPVAKSFEICAPPLAEQKRIGARLCEQFAEIERARAAADIQLKTIAALPGAYLREAFAVNV